MRKLSAKQKNYLINKIENYNIKNVEQMSSMEYSILENINDYETLFQDANRFIYDYRMNKLYNK